MPGDNKPSLGSLSDGIARMPRRLTARERWADHIFFGLQVLSRFAPMLGAIAGYARGGWRLCLAGVLAGWVFGAWIRRSLGWRGPDPFLGFYRRIGERANGSRRGALEWLIESLRGGGFSRQQCKEITAKFEEAARRVRAAADDQEREMILKQLDAEVKRISYSD